MISVVPLPEGWLDPDPDPREEDEPAARARELVSAGAALALPPAVLESLRGPAGSVLLDFDPRISAVRATAAIAVALGGGPLPIIDELGGSIGVVASASGILPNEAWHADSTPWREPNEWTVLGLLAKGESEEYLPTGILPLDAVVRRLDARGDGARALRTLPVEWRESFPDLEPLRSAILDESMPRWILPPVEAQLHRLPVELQAAVQEFTAAIAESDDYLEAVVRPDRVLVFANHRVLHRGPTSEAVRGRKLIRIKVGGVVL